MFSPRMLCWISSVPPAIDWAGVDTSTSATTASAGSVPWRSMPWAPAIDVCTRWAPRASTDRASLPIEPSEPGGRPSSRAALARAAVHSAVWWKLVTFTSSLRTSGSALRPVARARSASRSTRPIRWGYHS